MGVDAAAVVKFAAPLVVVFASGLVFPMKRDLGAEVAVRPPGALFGPVWVVLLLLVGAAWVRADGSGLPPGAMSALFVLLVAFLAAFAPAARGGLTVASVWLTYASLGAALACFAAVGDSVARVMLAPLVAWLVFAGQLAQLAVCESCPAVGR